MKWIIIKIFRKAKYALMYPISLLFIALNTKKAMQHIKRTGKIRVIFIVQYIPSWNKMKQIYLKMEDDSIFDPLIVCIPSAIHDHKFLGEHGFNDTYDYFINNGYDAINAMNIDGSWIDLKKYKPDFVFHSRPYNDFLPKQYTSWSLNKYTLLCNIQYGINTNVNFQDFCLEKDYYKDVYCYFSFDDSETEFYSKRYQIGIQSGIQKCYQYGAVCLEQTMIDATNIHTSYKKTVLWTPRWSVDPYVGGSNYFAYKDTIIELIKKHLDVYFILRPHPLMFSNFLEKGLMSEEEITSFKDFCINTPNVSLDETKEYKDTFNRSDIMISDSSSIVVEFFCLHKPIIYCHSDVKFSYVPFAKELNNSCYEVYNKDDLIKSFIELINDDDYKRQEREAVFERYFVDAINSSNNILSSFKTDFFQRPSVQDL